MGAQTDVKLVITAQDAASKAVGAITTAINQLVGAQDGFAKSGGTASSLLDEMKVAAAALAAALQKTDNAVTQAQAAFDRQAASLAETKTQLAAVTTQMEAADKAAAALNAQIAAGGEGADVYKVRLAAVAAEQKNLTLQANTLTRAITNQQAAMAKTGTALQQSKSTANVSGSAATFAVVPPEVAADTDKAATAAMRLALALPPIAPAAAEAEQGTRSLWTQLKAFTAAMFAVPAASGAAEESLGSFGSRSSTATQAAHLFRYELLSLALAFIGPYGVVAAIEAVLKSFQDLQTAQNKLGVVFNQNQAQVSSELGFLREQAVRLGLSFSTLADQYSTIAVSAQEAGLSLADTHKLFLSIADAARVLHLSTDDVSRVFLAFREMMSKGVVQSVQLVKQLGTDMPAATQIFADALGVSQAQLLKMMKTGQVFADSETMSKVADRLTEKYGAQLPAALQSVQTQIGRFQALLEISAQRIGQSGFMDGLSNTLKDINTELQSSTGQAVFAEVGNALGKIAGIIPFIVHNFGLVTDALKAWVALKITTWVSSLISGFVSLSVRLDAAIVGLEAAALAAKAFWAAVSGVGVLAAFGLETLLTNWLTGIDDATTALEGHQKILDAIAKGYADAGKSVDGWAQKIKGATEVEAVANLQNLQAALADVKNQLTLIPLNRTSVDPATSAKTGVFGQAELSDGLTTQLDNIIQKFKDGKTSYEDFKKAISDFGVANPSFQDFVVQVLDSTKNFGTLQTSIQQANAALDLMRGKATSADLKALGLDVANGWTGATNQLDKFKDALTKLGDLAPGIKKDLHFDDLLSQAQTDYAQAMKDAANDPALLAQAKAMYDKVVAQIHAYAAKDAASDFPVDNKAIIERIIYVEGGYAAKNNPASSANGVGQFTESTWLQFFNQLFPKLSDMTDAAKLALRANADVATKILAAETQANQLTLAQAGLPVTPANTYLMHFLGAAGGLNMIKVSIANPDELASKIASAAAVRANPAVLGGGQTAGDVAAWAASAKMMGGTSPITSTGETQIELFNSKLQDTIQGWKDSVSAAHEATAAQKEYGDAAQRVLFIQTQINEKQKEAKAAGGSLSQQQIADIKQWAGALFDVQHAAQDAQKAVDTVIGLSEQRATAIKELQTSFQDGSSAATIDALKQKVADLTAKILAALPAAQALAAALGDQKMVEALAKANLQLTTLKTGLTDAREMNVKLAGDLSSAWGNFLQTLGQSSKILVNLRTAFLQFAQTFVSDISQMILKQVILNGLEGTNIGKSLANFVNGATGTDAPLVAAEGVNTTAVTANTTALVANTAALSASGSAGGLGGILSAIFGGGSPSLPGYGAGDLSLINELPALHSGGIVGVDGTPRLVASNIFAGARRFHSGGVLGLDEIPAILQRGEEVLTRNDPRHIFNGGAAGGTSVKLTNVNVFDPADAFAAGLNSGVGGTALFNFVRANKSAMRAALG